MAVVKTTDQRSHAVTLTNEEMHLVIRPDLGGRIDQLTDRQTGHNWLWHPSDYDPNQTRKLAIGDSFDQNWSGGWDEIFPNDAAGPFRSYSLVDHGEFWSQPWEVMHADSHSIRMAYTCQTVPVTVEKTIQLDPGLAEATLLYSLQNCSDETLPFLFKQHCAIAIEAGDQIDLPDCLVEPVDLGFSRIIGKSGQTQFPIGVAANGSPVDLSNIPPRSSELQEFYYCSNLALGRCGIHNRRSQTTLEMAFDTADFPYVWVFQSYGGWRDCYVLVLEPATTMPYDLEVACQKHTVAQLQPQQKQQRRLTVRLQRL